MAVDAAAAPAAVSSAESAARAVTQTFAFEHLGAPWLVLPLAAAAIAVAVWSWRRYGPAPEGIAGLIARGCRAAALALAVIILAGPALRRTVTTDLPFRALVAVDRSASMARPDGPNGAPRIAQASELARALEGLKASNPLLAVDYRSIGGVAGAIDARDLLAGAVAATGSASPLADEVDRLVADARPDLLVVVSDGRVTAGSQLAAAAARWRARDLSVMALASGSEAVEPELFVDEIVVNREAALGEIEPVVVRLSGRALPPGPVKVTLEIEGEEPVTATVDPGTVPPEESAKLRPLEARLEATFRHEGAAKLKIAAVAAGAGTGGKPLATAPQELSVQVRERKLAVLILAHRPFYELRYLREAFKRDKTMTVHAYLADGRWRRWGTEGPETLPLGSAELAAYDVVIIGDLGRDALRDADLEHLENAVRRGGAGLVWMVGETGAVATFASSRIADLLPVTLPDAQAIARGYAEGVPRRLKRTDIAASLGLLDPTSGEGGLDWPQLPALLGAAPITRAQVKPGAEVLAEDQDGAPLVVTKAYPSGRAVLLGVDDTWRWRRNVGDRYLHRFHSQLLRYAASGRRGGERSWRLFAAPRRAVPGETVALDLMPLGQPESGGDSVSVSLTGPGGAQQLVRLDHEANGYAARILAPAPGSWTLEVASGIDARRVDPGELKVLAPEDELRDPRLDRAGLQAFAKASSGAVFNDARSLVAALPKDLRKSESVTIDVGLWDNWWMLGLLVGLFAVEWALRRANRLP